MVLGVGVFFLPKLRYQFWVPPSPEYMTRCRRTYRLSRRENQACVHCPMWGDSAWCTSKDWQVKLIRSIQCCYSQTLYFTRIYNSHWPIVHHCQITSATWMAGDLKKKRHFATNHFSQRTSTVFVTGVRTWRHWTSCMRADLEHPKSSETTRSLIRSQ